MNEHLQALLDRNQYSDTLKEQAVLRVLFGGEDPHEVSRELDIHNVFALNNWVAAYRKKIEKDKADLQAIKQRNKELERALKEANLMICALNRMIDVAENDLRIPIRKKRGTKRS